MEMTNWVGGIEDGRIVIGHRGLGLGSSNEVYNLAVICRPKWSGGYRGDKDRENGEEDSAGGGRGGRHVDV